MVQRYYLDTCIWVDLLQDRTGFGRVNLGLLASKLIIHIVKTNSTIICSRIVESELLRLFSKKEILIMFKYTSQLVPLISSNLTYKDRQYAQALAKKLYVPKADAYHAILASKSDSIFVSQDRHFTRLKRIVKWVRPQEII